MIPKLLRLKHWQLFILTFAVPLVFHIIGISFFAKEMIAFDQQRLRNNLILPEIENFTVPIICGCISLAFGLLILVWMYRVATKLQAFMHPEMRQLKINRFKIFFFFPLVYMIFLGVFIVPFFIRMADMTAVSGSRDIGSFLAIFFTMLIGHFFTFFCTIYTFYFLAKSLRSAEMQKEAHFSDYIGEFFLFWFYPVGIWFIQPRINKLFGDRIENEHRHSEINQ